MRVRHKVLAGFLFAAIVVAVSLRLVAELGTDALRLPAFGFPGGSGSREVRETIEITDYAPPPRNPIDDVLTDDRVEDKHPKFDPERVRPGVESGRLLNLSDAVIKLDVPMIRPDVEKYLTGTFPSYAAAIKALGSNDRVLPSVNMIDGKAKQFDDGLYAAIDSAYYRGIREKPTGHRELVRTMLNKLGPGAPASPFLAAGLELVGEKFAVTDENAKNAYLRAFRSDEVASKPVGFYDWSESLRETFVFLRYFQQAQRIDVARSIGGLLKREPALRAEYGKATRFLAKLSNPFVGRTNHECTDIPEDVEANRIGRISLFPASTSKERELFLKLFPRGLPPDADLMRELIDAIRSGKIDLAPKSESGWYEYQAYALETLLLPERGDGHERLLLTKAYKKRMLEAFQASITKRRETHIRQLDIAKTAASMPPPARIEPRLRVEPNPTYYLRVARSYAFLGAALHEIVGEEVLRSLRGLTQQGERSKTLHEEIGWMRDLFFGLHLLSAEDIGMRHQVREGEVASLDGARKTATDWLGVLDRDSDLAVDTRVAVPIMIDVSRKVTRTWITMGTRLAKLDASFARPPRMKLEKGQGDWETPEPRTLRTASYLIVVDDFAEVELAGHRTLTRGELRAILDANPGKDAALEALRR